MYQSDRNRVKYYSYPAVGYNPPTAVPVLYCRRPHILCERPSGVVAAANTPVTASAPEIYTFQNTSQPDHHISTAAADATTTTTTTKVSTCKHNNDIHYYQSIAYQPLSAPVYFYAQHPSQSTLGKYHHHHPNNYSSTTLLTNVNSDRRRYYHHSHKYYWPGAVHPNHIEYDHHDYYQQQPSKGMFLKRPNEDVYKDDRRKVTTMIDTQGNRKGLYIYVHIYILIL